MSTTTPRAISQEEATARVLQHVRDMAAYWASLPDKTPQERCDGLAYSLLSLIDGEAEGMPALRLTLDPHPDDKANCQRNGENWFEEGMPLLPWLHERYYQA